MERIVFVSYCLFNQFARAKGVKNTIPGQATIKPIINLLLKANVAIVQMPCPEIDYEGVLRKAGGQDAYNNPRFLNICDTHARKILEYVMDYQKNGFEILGFIGVNGSPTCGVSLTAMGHKVYKDEPGLFFKRLIALLKENNIKTKFIGMSLLYPDQRVKTLKQVQDMLREDDNNAKPEIDINKLTEQYKHHLNSNRPDQVLRAINVLWHMDVVDNEVDEKLMLILETNADVDIRRDAVRYVRGREDKKFETVLLHCLKDNDYIIRGEAFLAYKKIDPDFNEVEEIKTFYNKETDSFVRYCIDNEK